MKPLNKKLRKAKKELLKNEAFQELMRIADEIKKSPMGPLVRWYSEKEVIANLKKNPNWNPYQEPID